MSRQHNFSAGPAALPHDVVQALGPNLIEFGEAGAGIMEISHRSKHFDAVIQDTESRLRNLLSIPEDYRVLFLQGGASLQFTMAPMNLTSSDNPMGYILSGHWANRAHAEALKLEHPAPVLWDGSIHDFSELPTDTLQDLRNPAPHWVHYTSNNTIYGTQFKSAPTGSQRLVADMSSDIASKPIDVQRHAVIYAGAQKNLGPSGVTLVILSPEAVEASRAQKSLPSMLNYGLQVDKNSMLNTPNTFGIFALGKVLEWIEAQGGLASIEERNEVKAARLYQELDQSSFWSTAVANKDRSTMNVTWGIHDTSLEPVFVAEAQEAGLLGLKGHRLIGGLRASIYNACSIESVEALIEFMREFERRHG